MKVIRILLCALIAPLLFSSCDQSDDLDEIFVGKTWKLTQIFDDDNSFQPQISRDYWTTEESREKSYNLLNQTGNFIISFEGNEQDGRISGEYTGHATTANISGTWNAEGSGDRAFTTNQQSVSDGDVFGNAFVNALINAYRYEGDSYNLRIYFREGQRNKYLLLRAL